MSKKIAIVNLSDRKGALVRVEVFHEDGEPEVTDLAPNESLGLDEEEFTRCNISSFGGRGGERFVGERTGERIAPVVAPHFRTLGGQVDHPPEPEPEKPAEEE